MPRGRGRRASGGTRKRMPPRRNNNIAPGDWWKTNLPADPPPTRPIPWNRLILTILFQVTGGQQTNVTADTLFTELKTQLGIGEDSDIVLRLNGVRIWARLNSAFLAVTFKNWYRPNVLDVSSQNVLTLEDTGTPVRFPKIAAKCKNSVPLRLKTDGSAGATQLFTVITSATCNLQMHLQVAWRPALTDLVKRYEQYRRLTTAPLPFIEEDEDEDEHEEEEEPDELL